MKKLYKVNEGKILDGVCAGIAEYFHIDPTLVRVIWAIMAAWGGFGIIAYLICAIIIPRKPMDYVDVE